MRENVNLPWAVFIAVLFLCVSLPPVALSDEFRAGAAKIDITPPTGYPMWGYGSRHDSPCLGLLDPLLARAVVLEVDDNRLAIVSLDLGRPPTRESFERIRKMVLAKAKVNHLFLVASHTHHGPVLEVPNWPKGKKPYVRVLEEKIVDVIHRASQRLRPTRYGIKSTTVTYNRNRHSRKQNPPVDSEFLVMRMEQTNGKLIAHLVNFAAHPTMHSAKVRKFSADFPGAMTKFVEKKTNVPCLFLQGAAGDLSPNPGKVQGPDAFGKVLGALVLKLSKDLKCKSGQTSILKVQERNFQFKMRFDLSNPLVQAMFSYAFFPKLVAFYAREYRAGVRPRMTTAVLDRRIGFVGVSGEFFCDHALSLKRRSRLEHLFFLGYCNDYHQYFPTIQACAEGGYGADLQVSPVEVGAGESMMNQALIDLYRLRGSIKK
ncbi:MAG: neutral/alkaline non-lysosomal ceramidase N-terminal domain-containing protein [Gemmataceae bacterium]